MTDEQAHAYIAGLLDGEGCVSIVKHKGNIGIEVAVAMTNPSGIEFAQARYGGSVRRAVRARSGENWKDAYQWRIRASNAERLLRDVQPYLLVKSQQCALALSVREHLRNGGTLRRGPRTESNEIINAEIRAFRESAKAQMHQLNRRGVY